MKMKAHGKAKREIEAAGGDPNTDDTEGPPARISGSDEAAMAGLII
jgi:hypothetical protein